MGETETPSISIVEKWNCSVSLHFSHVEQGKNGLETEAPGSEPAHEYTYDLGNPPLFLVDARALELSLNEDYRTGVR